jgi:hypothetical protein
VRWIRMASFSGGPISEDGHAPERDSDGPTLVPPCAAAEQPHPTIGDRRPLRDRAAAWRTGSVAEPDVGCDSSVMRAASSD